MASLVEIRTERRRRASALSPELRTFIDRAVVPILVKEFLAEQQIAVASQRTKVVKSHATSAPAKAVHTK